MNIKFKRTAFEIEIFSKINIITVTFDQCKLNAEY